MFSHFERNIFDDIMLVPYEKYVLITRLSPQEIHYRLDQIVDTSKHFNTIFSMARREKLYHGELSESNFKIVRKIGYRNSFLPVIQGRVSSSAQQTRIDIQMRLHMAVLIFIIVWLGVVGLVCIATMPTLMKQLFQAAGEKFDPKLLLPFGMLIFGYLLVTLPFKMESRISKKFLAKLLEGQD